jgi:hypothetical protein
VSLGNQLFIWGGLNESGTALNSGAIYDPRTDAWRMVASDANTPSPRADATAVWTGAVVVVFGGLEPSGQTALADGALYDPVEDRWRTMSAGPTARAAAFGAFTDEQVLVWAGRDGAGEALAGLEFFDPEADQWREAENRWDEPSERYDASPASGELTFWIFGGRTPSGEASDEAAYYSFTSEEWLQRWDSVDLSARWGGFGAFVDGRYYTWGGRDLDNLFDDGMSYNPLDTWESIEQSGAPSGRYSAFRESGWSLAVDERWFILLGGLDNPGTYRSDGARYDTQAAAWSAIEAWPGSASHAFGAVDWVAGEIVVWGGRDGSALTNTGVRYLPAD